MSKPLKFLSTSIGFREVPDEISLLINITNCPCRCAGCHSPELWEDAGKLLDLESLQYLLLSYAYRLKSPVTCITFLGDGGNLEDLGKLIEYCHKKGFLTCLYTGSTGAYNAIVCSNKTLDYIKVGRYMKEMGPLDSPSTNQRFYKIHYLQLQDGTDNGWSLEDITYKFRHKNEN